MPPSRACCALGIDDASKKQKAGAACAPSPACGGGLGWGYLREPDCPCGGRPPPVSHLRCNTTSPASGRGAPSMLPDHPTQLHSALDHGRPKNKKAGVAAGFPCSIRL